MRAAFSASGRLRWFWHGGNIACGALSTVAVTPPDTWSHVSDNPFPFPVAWMMGGIGRWAGQLPKSVFGARHSSALTISDTTELIGHSPRLE
jgi:hypothetical protein